jgi:acetoin utilization protein AcuB
MLVQSVMTRSVVTTDPTHSVQSARQLMFAGRFRHLPGVDQDKLVGIVSDRDLDGSDCSHARISDVMHSNVIVVTPDTPVEVAAELMVDNKIGALPVVEAGTDAEALVGIVSQTDLFVVLAHLLGGDGPSTRLELLLDDLPGQLAVIASLAQARHVSISSLVTLPTEPGSAHRRVVLRIGTIVARPFVTELERAGIAVDAPGDLDG